MVKGPLPGHEMRQPQATPAPRASQPAPSLRTPVMAAVMVVLSLLCLAGGAITAGQTWPNVAGLIYAGWMLAGGAMFAAIATALHLLHRIATAVERRTSA